MKTKTKHYKIYVTPLVYDKEAPRKAQIDELSKAYVEELERIIRLYPTQWYNFFPFWESE
jgi:predicted LPLAT superfamily acyltransferase